MLDTPSGSDAKLRQRAAERVRDRQRRRVRNRQQQPGAAAKPRAATAAAPDVAAAPADAAAPPRPRLRGPQRVKRLHIAERKLIAAAKNGAVTFEAVDRRCAEMRRLKAIVAAHTADLGGEDNLTHSETILMRRAAVVALHLEKQEQRFAAQKFEIGPEQFNAYRNAIDTLRRLFETLGLQRRARRVDNDLNEYLRGRQRAGEGVAFDGEAEPAE